MNSFRLPIYPIIFICLFLGLVCSLPANAKKKSGSSTTKTTKPDTRVLVTAVDATNNQITITDKRTGKVSVYTVDMATQITIEKKPGSIAGIKVGQEVLASTERNNNTLDSIDLGAAGASSKSTASSTAADSSDSADADDSK